MMPPPLKPGSPQPKLSMKTMTTFGFSSASTNELERHRHRIERNDLYSLMSGYLSWIS
jgi:hypothetical protein